LTGNRPQSAPACSFLRYGQLWSRFETLYRFDEKVVCSYLKVHRVSTEPSYLRVFKKWFLVFRG
jgi:hypothetical protein